MPFYPMVRSANSLLPLYHFDIVSASAKGTVDGVLSLSGSALGFRCVI